MCERIFGQPGAVAGAYLDEFSNYTPMKLNNSDGIVKYTSVLSSLVNVLQSLSYERDLRSGLLLNQVVRNLAPNLKESRSLQTLKKKFVAYIVD